MIQCRCSVTMVTLPHFLVCIYRNSFKKMQCDCLNWMGCCTSRKAKDHGKNITLFWGLQESIIHLKEKLRLAFLIFKYFKKTVFFQQSLLILYPFSFPLSFPRNNTYVHMRLAQKNVLRICLSLSLSALSIKQNANCCIFIYRYKNWQRRLSLLLTVTVWFSTQILACIVAFYMYM